MTAAVLSIAGAIMLGAMSPGPSFLMVARTAIARSRADGLAAALGMGVGGVVFAALALAGLHAVLVAVPWLYVFLKVAGGAYLVFIGWMIWRGARQPVALSEANVANASAAFWLGLATQLSNPKTAVVYARVFVSLLPREIPLALSAPSPRAAYLRSKTWIDRAAGTVMALLGLRLILTR
jgi:threonine/homoserine/homoserine lactone efflux protein